MSVLSQALLGFETANAPVPFQSLYTQTLTGTTLSLPDNTIVLITPISISSYTKFRVTAQNGVDTSSTIDAMYFGQLTGTYSFASAPTQVTWGGGASTSLAFTVSGESVVSNEISYTPSGAGNLCIAFHVASNSSSLRSLSNLGTGWAAWVKTGNSASTQSKTGFTVNGTQRTVLVTEVEAK